MAVLVIRWFGGIKLGAGGLVRGARTSSVLLQTAPATAGLRSFRPRTTLPPPAAYSGAAAAALRDAPTRRVAPRRSASLRAEYRQLGTVYKILDAHQAVRTGEEFLEDGSVRIEVDVEASLADGARARRHGIGQRRASRSRFFSPTECEHRPSPLQDSTLRCARLPRGRLGLALLLRRRRHRRRDGACRVSCGVAGCGGCCLTAHQRCAAGCGVSPFLSLPPLRITMHDRAAGQQQQAEQLADGRGGHRRVAERGPGAAGAGIHF